MYKKILVPLDGSKLSEHALDHLSELLTPSSDTGVVLLRVVEPLTVLYAGGPGAIDATQKAQKQLEADAVAYLNKIENGLKRRKLSVETAVIEGIPADVILDFASQHKVDLIIMSTHGRSGITRWFFGSVAEKVIRHSTVPVLISPPLGTRAGK
jgi:nucleotide-binding universal stress UspA family protein